MRTVPLSEVEGHLSEIADEVNQTHERVQVVRNDGEPMVLMSAADFESMEATLELLADPEAQERIREAEAAIDRGEGLDEAAVRAMFAARSQDGNDGD